MSKPFIDIIPGKVEKIDANTYDATINLLQRGKILAHCLRVENEPKVDDEVIVIKLGDDEDSYAIYFPFKKLTRGDFIGIEHADYRVQWLDDGGVKLTGGGQTITVKDGKTTFESGEWSISGDKTTIETDKNKIAGSKLDIESSATEMTKSKVTHNGTCAPTGSGGFCGIPVCPFTGAPQTGPTIQ